MTEKFNILGKYIKDLSSETKNTETYIYVKDFISKYQLNININSKAIKKQMVEIDTIMNFEDKSEAKLKSHFEMTYTTVIKVSDEVKEKKELEKIILCDVQNEIYPFLEKTFLNLLHSSGFTKVEFEKKVNFEDLYNKRQN
mgnify:CR=1 FL=1